jgi:hypothetical protein
LLFELNLQEVFDPGFQTILSSERFGSRDFLIGELMYNAVLYFGCDGIFGYPLLVGRN